MRGVETAGVGHNSMAQSVFRAHGDRGYTKLRNEFLQDSRISDETRGLVARLLSRPTDWHFTVKEIIASGPSGRDKVYRMMKEAEQYGYIAPEKPRRDNGTYSAHVYLVTDDPQVLIHRAAEEILALQEKVVTQPPICETRSGDLGDKPTGVYVMVSGERTKIGVSRDPAARLTNVNSFLPEKATLRYILTTDHWTAQLIERAAHAAMQDRHLDGEWFACSLDEAITAIRTASNITVSTSGLSVNGCEPQETTDKKPFPEKQEVDTVFNFAPFPDKPDTAQPDTAQPDTAQPDTAKPTSGKPDTTNKRVLQTNDKTKVAQPAPVERNSALDFMLNADAPKAEDPEYRRDFEEWWAVYPRKTGKGACAGVWERLTAGQRKRAMAGFRVQLPVLIAKANDIKGNFCPHPRTWLQQGRYDDDVPNAVSIAPISGGNDLLRRPADIPEVQWQNRLKQLVGEDRVSRDQAIAAGWRPC